MKFGVDVGSTRLDDLDKQVIKYVEARTKIGLSTRVLDVGCGAGGLAVALAQAGATVTALDIGDYSEAIMTKVEVLPLTLGKVTCVQSDIVSFLDHSTQTFDCVVLQRVLHYIPYNEARKVLTALSAQADLLYVAVTGITTAIANHYPIPKSPIEQRFEKLDTVGQEIFSITAPVCLYSETELKQLIIESGWSVIWSRVSDFGNIKVVAQTNLYKNK